MNRPPPSPFFFQAVENGPTKQAPAPALSFPGDKDYVALVRAFNLLETTGSQTWEVLSNGEHLPKLALALGRLVESKILTQFGNTYGLADRKGLQKIWGDEGLFCALGSWTTFHVTDMQVLLHETSLIKRAAALKALVDFTRAVLAERTRVSKDNLNKLSSFGKLPTRVQEELEAANPSAPRDTVEQLRRLDNEAQMLTWIEQRYRAPAAMDQEAPELEYEEHEEEPGLRVLVETSLKVAAATYEKVNKIEKIIGKLVRDLGGEVQE